MGQPSGNATEPTPGTTTQQYSATSPSLGMYDAGATGAAGTDTSEAMGSNSGPTQTYGVGATNATGSAGMMDVSILNDAQLAAVVQTIHQGEIQEAQLAQSKASSADVKGFAREMLSAHRDMLNQGNALLAKLQIMPVDNAVSNQLKSDAQNEMATLQAMRGKDFDHDYINAQVRGHNKALELIDRILPNVKSAEWKASLQSARPKIEGHLRHAEQVQQTLQTGATNALPHAH